jgi:hypothetical protein
MNRKIRAVALASISVFIGIAGLATDYSHFAELPEKEKDRIVWELHDQHQWGMAEQKPICRDVLANQGYRSANSIAWTTDAIDLAEKQGWNEMNPLIRKVYEAPRNIWVYERAFRYLRRQAGKAVPSVVVKDAETIEAAGFFRSEVTDAQLTVAKNHLERYPDKEVVLVYAIKIACWHAGKGGTERGRKAAAEVLRGLDPEHVIDRLRHLHRDCQDYMRPEIEWVAKYLSLSLQNAASKQ